MHGIRQKIEQTEWNVCRHSSVSVDKGYLVCVYIGYGWNAFESAELLSSCITPHGHFTTPLITVEDKILNAYAVWRRDRCNLFLLQYLHKIHISLIRILLRHFFWPWTCASERRHDEWMHCHAFLVTWHTRESVRCLFLFAQMFCMLGIFYFMCFHALKHLHFYV